jgi:hypothetical protein
MSSTQAVDGDLHFNQMQAAFYFEFGSWTMFKKTALISLLCILLCATTVLAGWEQVQYTSYPALYTYYGRSGHAMATLGNGMMMMDRGMYRYFDWEYLDHTWVFDYTKTKWTKILPVNIGGALPYEWDHAAAYIGRKSIVEHGSGTWLYSYSDNSWTILSPNYVGGTLSQRERHKMCFLDDGLALLFGGNDSSCSDTWVYDLDANVWRSMASNIAGDGFSARESFGMAYIGDRKAVMFGGVHSGTSDYIDETWVYDYQQNQWTKMAPTIVGGDLSARKDNAMAYLGGDRVLMFGGYPNGGAESWIYDLSENTWTKLSPVLIPPFPYNGLTNGVRLANLSLGRVILLAFSTVRGGGYGDVWEYTVEGGIEDSLQWNEVPTGVQISWSMPEHLVVPEHPSGPEFTIFRDGVQISPVITSGQLQEGRIHFSFIDDTVATNRISRYQLRESNPMMGSEYYHRELVVPYCQ